MKYPFLLPSMLLLQLLTRNSKASSLNDFLVTVSENVTDQVCFVNFGKPVLRDIHSNISKSLRNVPQVTINRRFNSSSDMDRNTGMRKCFLTFVEFDNGQYVSSLWMKNTRIHNTDYKIHNTEY